MRYNEEMHKAGILIASEGLNPAGQGARIGVSGGKRAVLDGPFIESKELVGGFYLIDVQSMDEAIAWALRSPTGLGSDDVLTIHPMTEASDLPPEMVKIISLSCSVIDSLNESAPLPLDSRSETSQPGRSEKTLLIPQSTNRATQLRNNHIYHYFPACGDGWIGLAVRTQPHH